MIEQELVLLGLLKEGPKHGYEIKRKIREIFSLFAGAQPSSVYYPLAVLQKQGLLEKHQARSGRRPMRFVYALTPKGERRFEELLDKSFLDFKRPHFTLDISLYFLRFARSAVAKRRLRARMLLLSRLSAGLKPMVASFKQKSRFILADILEHDLQMVNAEHAFLQRFIEKFSQQQRT